MPVVIHCKYDERVPISSLRPHPKNRNVHPDDQIERLAKIIGYQGLRAPIVVSSLSGYIVKGHGTLLALAQLGEDFIPIVRQSFENEDQEYAYLQSDNAIASWATLDMEAINFDISSLMPDFDILHLGLKDFKVAETALPELSTEDRGALRQMAFQMTEDQIIAVERAIKISKDMGPFEDTNNSNSNGNALARMAEIFTTAHGSRETD